MLVSPQLRPTEAEPFPSLHTEAPQVLGTRLSDLFSERTCSPGCRLLRVNRPAGSFSCTELQAPNVHGFSEF